jgi:transporter family-2 protein
MGAASLTATVVTGQLVFSVVVDHFGWIGFDLQPAG